MLFVNKYSEIYYHIFIYLIGGFQFPPELFENKQNLYIRSICLFTLYEHIGHYTVGRYRHLTCLGSIDSSEVILFSEPI